MNEEPKFEVTKKIIEASIVQEINIQVGFKTSVCVLMLNTGAECVGTYSPVSVAKDEDLDIAENKKKARKIAFKRASEVLKGITEWRKAVYMSEKARAEAEKAQANQAIESPEAPEQGPSAGPGVEK